MSISRIVFVGINYISISWARVRIVIRMDRKSSLLHAVDRTVIKKFNICHPWKVKDPIILYF